MFGNSLNAIAFVSTGCNPFWSCFLEFLKIILNWPSITLIISLIFIFCFRKAIEKFIENIKRFKGGKDGIEFEMETRTEIEVFEDNKKELFDEERTKQVISKDGTIENRVFQYNFAEKNVINRLKEELGTIDISKDQKIYSSFGPAIAFDGVVEVNNGQVIAIEVIYPSKGKINSFTTSKIRNQARFALKSKMKYLLAIVYDETTLLNSSVNEVHSILKDVSSSYEIRSYNFNELTK